MGVVPPADHHAGTLGWPHAPCPARRMSATAPPQADPALVARLRADLGSAAYTVDEVDALLGPLASAALSREQVLPAQRATADVGTPLATLVRLFGLGDAVDPEEAAAALPTLG